MKVLLNNIEVTADCFIVNDTSEFTNTNYCSLPKLLNHNSDFEAVMKTYLHITLFKKLFPELPKNQYVVNSTDSITIKDDMITFKGKVFELP